MCATCREINAIICMCGSEDDIFAFLIAPFNSCLLGNDAPRALGGKVFRMKNSVISLALM